MKEKQTFKQDLQLYKQNEKGEIPVVEAKNIKGKKKVNYYEHKMADEEI